VQAARAAPKNPRPMTYLGDAHFHAGDFAQAKQNYEAALSRDAKFVDAHKGLARALAGLQNLAGARAAIEKLRAVNASEADALARELFP
jgi:Tfp pilus assembly protein PilF